MSLIELLDIDLLLKIAPIISVIIAGLGLWLSWKSNRERRKRELEHQKKVEKIQTKTLDIQKQQLDLLSKQTLPSSPKTKQKSGDLEERKKRTTGETIIDIIKTIGFISRVKEEIDKYREKDSEE